MPPEKKQTIALFGAGLVGALLGLFLAKRGFKVDIYERRADMRAFGTGEGRSINLALSERGWRALEELGIADEIRAIGLPMSARMMHAPDGTTVSQPYGKEGQNIYSISRFALNKKLMDLAQQQPDLTIHFQHKCLDVDFVNTKAHLLNLATGQHLTANPDFIFGADGAFSAVRSSMQYTDKFNFSQHYIDHGYKEFNIDPKPDGTFALDKDKLHIWPRGNFMMIALPNPDGTFTCTLFFPFDGTTSFASVAKTEGGIKTLFKKHFPDLITLIPDYETQFANNPTSSLVTVKCYPWVINKSIIVGDAAHAIVPFYGQGMNAGFEDCTVLGQLLDKGHSLDRAMELFQEIRKPDADAIAQLAFNNFIEMRDKVADPTFLLRKKIEARLHDMHPDTWVPLYTMVAFTSISYAYALNKGHEQDLIMDKIMQTANLATLYTTPGFLEQLWRKVHQEDSFTA